jgi:O-antigen ligase
MLLIIWDLFDSTEAIDAALQAYVLGAYVSVASIIVSFITETVEKFPAHQRFQALGFEVDGIALIVATAAPAAWYLAVRPRSRRRSPLITMMDVAYFPIGAFALVLTGTRGAVLASVPTVAFVVWSFRRIRGAKRIVAPAFLFLAAVLIASFAPEGMLDRIGSIGHELTGSGVATGNYGEGNIGGRTSTWSESLAAFLERPVTGVGIDAHRKATQLGKEAHNLYLSVLAETGVVGFLLFSWVIWTVFARIRHLTGWERWYWFAQLLLLAIGAVSLSLEDSKSVWIFLALAFASATATGGASVTQREREPISVAASRSPGDDSSIP